MAWPLKPPLTVLAETTAGYVLALLGKAPFRSRAVGTTCTTWKVSAEAYQFTTRSDSSAPTRRMMPLMLAGAAVTTLASFMLAAAIAIRAHIVMRLRTGECDVRD